MSNIRILCIGPLWRGSNAGALFKSLGHNGALISVVDEFYYIPLVARHKLLKVLDKVFRPFYINSFNNAILKEFNLFKPDFVLIYKGAFVYPDTVSVMKKDAKVVCFYPDVSFHTHGSLVKSTLPLYDTVFTTKTFGIDDMRAQLGQNFGVFVPHGFDPDIHRKIEISDKVRNQFSCDASFIGTWSPHKEEYLTHLVEKVSDLNLKIWGSQWGNASKKLTPYIQGTEILGDLYAIAIQCSKINIALLSEKVKGASDGDRITSRTFHIPSSYGFMLHQNSIELQLYFDINNEIAVFDSKESLVNQVKYFLKDSGKTEIIKRAGYERALKDHCISRRAEYIIECIKKL